MRWSEHLADLADACVDAFGTDVVLPDGVTVVQGVFDQVGSAANAPWPEVGLNPRLGQIDNPRVWLLAATAASLTVEDRLLVDGVPYLVSAPPKADGSRLTAVELQPDTTGAADGARWQ